MGSSLLYPQYNDQFITENDDETHLNGTHLKFENDDETHHKLAHLNFVVEVMFRN